MSLDLMKHTTQASGNDDSQQKTICLVQPLHVIVQSVRSARKMKRCSP